MFQNSGVSAKFIDGDFGRISLSQIKSSINPDDPHYPRTKLIALENSEASKEIKLDAIKKLQKFNWTGNVRELRNVIERLVILSENSIISKEDVINFSGK